MTTLTFRPLHPLFGAEASPIELRNVRDAATLGALRRAMDQYAVLVFRDQKMDGDEQLEFTRRFDGELHARTSNSVLTKNRLGHEALADVSNLDETGALPPPEDRRRMAGLANRLWHTDASFVDPAGRYSLLLAKLVPPVPAGTEFADMRAAYDALDDERKAMLEGLTAYHSVVHSRSTLGFEFSDEERVKLGGAEHPVVRTIPGSGRRSLYFGSHASHIVQWLVPEGRLLLRDLADHATRRQFVHHHEWRPDDLVIWDNRATMHRAMPFDDTRHRRELRRTTTLDLPFALAAD